MKKGRCLSEQAERGEAGEGAAAQADAENDASEDVAEEMHNEHDVREGDAGGEEKQRQLERRIEIAEHERDGKCGHGVSGREGEAIGRTDAEMLEAGRLAELRRNVARLEDRAVFVIPEILESLLDGVTDPGG